MYAMSYCLSRLDRLRCITRRPFLAHGTLTGEVTGLWDSELLVSKN